MRRRARAAGQGHRPARNSLPRAGGTRGSRADRRPVPQGRAAPLTRGRADPVSSARRRPHHPLPSTRTSDSARYRHVLRQPPESADPLTGWRIDALPRRLSRATVAAMLARTAGRSKAGCQSAWPPQASQPAAPRSRRRARTLARNLVSGECVPPDVGMMLPKQRLRLLANHRKDRPIWLGMNLKPHRVEVP